MEKTYGPEKAKEVLYASKNAGTISGIDAICDSITRLGDRIDAMCARSDDGRADAGGRSGTITFTTSDELDMGKDGAGEVEFSILIKYTIEVQPEFGRIVSLDWNDDDGEGGVDLSKPSKNPPKAKIIARIERELKSPKWRVRALEALMERVRL